MKKSMFLMMLAAAALPAALPAQISKQTCTVCGVKQYIDDANPGKNGWERDEFRGFCCPKNDCREQVAKWAYERYQTAKKNWLEQDKKAKNRAEERAFVEKACQRLAAMLKYRKANLDPAAEQIKIVQQLSARYNAQRFWETFVAYGDMKAIRYFWPDPADEKVYLSSKKQMEENQRSAHQEKEEKYNVDAGTLLTNMRNELMLNVTGNRAVVMARKKGPAAFALGRSKKDQSVRFVDSEEFSQAILASAVRHHRTDVFAYLCKQCGGLTPELQKRMFQTWLGLAADTRFQLFQAEKALFSRQNALKVAEDKFDQQKIRQQISVLESRIASLKKVRPSEAMLTLILQDLSPLTAAELYDAVPRTIKSSLGPDEFQMQLNAAMKMQTAQYQGKSKNILNSQEQLEKELAQLPTEKEKEAMTKELAQPVQTRCAAYFAKAPGQLGQWFRWREAQKKNWKAGRQDRWIREMKSGTVPGEWVWRVGVPSELKIGFVTSSTPFKWYWKEDLTHARKPGYVTGRTEGQWCWKAGLKHPDRPGYCSGESEGSFVWRPGVPNVKVVGLVAGAQEGQWVTAPGFEKKGNKAVWKAGLKHPKHPGVVSAKKKFTWLPDGTHLWKDPKSDDLKVEKDRKVLRSEVQTGARVGSQILLHR